MAYEPILPQYYDTIRSALSGQVPQGNLDFLKQQAAEYGIRTGMPGSDLSKYFGLNRMFDTSLGLTKFAAQALQPDVQSSLQQGNWLERYNIQRGEEERQRQLRLQEQHNQEALQSWRNQGPFTPPIYSQGGTPSVPRVPAAPRQPMNRGGLNTNQMLSGLLSKYGDYGTSAPMGGYTSMDPMGGNILGSTSNIYMSPDTITEDLYGFGGLTPEQISNTENEQMAQEYGFGGLPPESIYGTASNDYAGNWGNEAADYWSYEG